MTTKHEKKRRHADEQAAPRPQEAPAPLPGGELGDRVASDSAEVEGEISALREELEGLNGKWLRALADLDNYKKRVERDRSRWADAAREQVLLDLLEVVDNFERALGCETAEPVDESFRGGIELILRQLVDVLRKHGVEPIATNGCEFDPNVHEAVGHIESPGHDSNHIVEETQKGYMLGDRLLRCSKVVVSK